MAQPTDVSISGSDTSSSMPEFEDVYANGEVVFILKRNRNTKIIKRLRVSAHALSVGSEVFAAMFAEGRFAEGQNLSRATPKEIHLPDDDGEAMEILLRLLHLKNEIILGPKTIRTVQHLAQLADKYLCVDALSLASPKIITNAMAGHKGSHCHSELAEVAWVFKQASLFRDLTKLMVLHDGGDFADSHIGSSHDIPAYAMLFLETQRTRARKTLRNQIRIWSNSKRSSVHRKRMVAGFTRSFESLYGEAIDFEDDSVDGICKSLTEIASGIGKSTSDNKEVPNVASITLLVTEIRETIRGLCYECVRTGEPDLQHCKYGDHE